MKQIKTINKGETMKYLLTITLIALSINAFSMDKYVVCMEHKLLFITVNMQSPKLTTLPRCVNDYMEKGYAPLSGLNGWYIISTTNPKFSSICLIT